jgi:hypothetical protein
MHLWMSLLSWFICMFLFWLFWVLLLLLSVNINYELFLIILQWAEHDLSSCQSCSNYNPLPISQILVSWSLKHLPHIHPLSLDLVLLIPYTWASLLSLALLKFMYLFNMFNFFNMCLYYILFWCDFYMIFLYFFLVFFIVGFSVLFLYVIIINYANYYYIAISILYT